jgi:hypothetical protein
MAAYHEAVVRAIATIREYRAADLSGTNFTAIPHESLMVEMALDHTSLTRVNSTNVLDKGLMIGGRGRRMNSKVNISQTKACIENKRGIKLGSISICPWPASAGPYI